MKKVFFGLLLLLIAASYCYSHRDLFRDTDTIGFGATPPDLLAKIKVFAFVNNPQHVELKNGSWFGDGQPATVVYDGKQNYGLAKKYTHVDFYITVNDAFFSNQLSFDKPDTKDAYDIQLTITPKNESYSVNGIALHLGEQFLTFDEKMMPYKKGVEVKKGE